MDEDTIYFIISALNQLNIDSIRNKILSKFFFKSKISLFIYLMTIKEIITVPDEILKKVSEPIEKIESRKNLSIIYLTQCTIQMELTCCSSNRYSQRILVVDVSTEDEKSPNSISKSSD